MRGEGRTIDNRIKFNYGKIKERRGKREEDMREV